MKKFIRDCSLFKLLRFRYNNETHWEIVKTTFYKLFPSMAHLRFNWRFFVRFSILTSYYYLIQFNILKYPLFTFLISFYSRFYHTNFRQPFLETGSNVDLDVRFRVNITPTRHARRTYIDLKGGGGEWVDTPRGEDDMRGE